MKTNERTRAGWFFSAAVLVALAGACGGAASTPRPSLGSESHFLARCSDECGGGFDCIGGICTRSCLTDGMSCDDLGASVECTNQSVEPGEVAVCDARCASDADCSGLGVGYQCSSGFCRYAAAPDGDAVSSVTCRDVGSYQVGKEGGYLPCCPGLQELQTPVEVTDENGALTCAAVPANSYSCLRGVCGDGTCESNETRCSCPADCAGEVLLPPPMSCEFSDAVAPPGAQGIDVYNAGTVPLYIEANPVTCEGSQPLVFLQRDGAFVPQRPNGCMVSCTRAIAMGWPNGYAALPGFPSCPDEPCGAAPVRIEPGQTLTRPAAPEVQPQSMPGECATGTTTDEVYCYTFIEPSAGLYTLTVRAAYELRCVDPSQDCSCQPAADGTCTNPNVTLYGTGAPLPLTFTSEGTSLRGQTVTIAAP